MGFALKEMKLTAIWIQNGAFKKLYTQGNKNESKVSHLKVFIRSIL